MIFVRSSWCFLNLNFPYRLQLVSNWFCWPRFTRLRFHRCSNLSILLPVVKQPQVGKKVSKNGVRGWWFGYLEIYFYFKLLNIVGLKLYHETWQREFSWRACNMSRRWMGNKHPVMCQLSFLFRWDLYHRSSIVFPQLPHIRPIDPWNHSCSW